MERLTRNFTEMEDGAEYTPCVQCDIRHICMWKDRYTKEAYTGGCFLMDIYERLAAYEDTGLTPEEAPTAHEMAQIYSLIEENKVYRALAIPVDRLRELAAADKEGHVVVLPCKDWFDVVFGDRCLFWGIDTDYIEEPIREISVDDENRISWYNGWKTVFLNGTDENGQAWEFSPDDIGETVFLSREDAEAALKEAKHDG